jgi:hypothetical protein
MEIPEAENVVLPLEEAGIFDSLKHSCARRLSWKAMKVFSNQNASPVAVRRLRNREGAVDRPVFVAAPVNRRKPRAAIFDRLRQNRPAIGASKRLRGASFTQGWNGRCSRAKFMNLSLRMRNDPQHRREESTGRQLASGALAG